VEQTAFAVRGDGLEVVFRGLSEPALESNDDDLTRDQNLCAVRGLVDGGSITQVVDVWSYFYPSAI